MTALKHDQALESKIKKETEKSLSSPPRGDYHRQTYNHFYKIEEIEKIFYSYLISKAPSEKYTFMEIGGQCGMHARHFVNVFRENIDKFVLNDISENVLQEARTRLEGFLDVVELNVSPAEEISIGRKFNGIYMNASLHHFSDPFKALKTIKGLLKPGGIIAACEPMVWNPLNLYRAVAIKEERNQFHIASRGNIRKYLNSLGFDIVEDRVLHLRLKGPLFDKYALHKKLENFRLLDPMAIVFMFGAIAR